MQKVFIADTCEEFRTALSGSLRTQYRVESFHDGAVVLGRLRKEKPDLLIIDLMLPNQSGMTILKAVKEENLCGAVIVTGRFFSDYIVDSLKQYPVAFLVLKPCSVGALIDRIQDLCASIAGAENDLPDPHCAASGILLALNFSTNKKGFRYCRESILMLSDNPGKQVTKEVYPALAKENNTTRTAVEKAIRSAIDSAWESRNDVVWRQYFMPAPNGVIPRPTNTQFLTRIADVIEAERRDEAWGGRSR